MINSTNEQCPNCKNINIKFVDKYKFNVLYDEIFFKKINIFNCHDCDLNFVVPMPSESILNEYYSFIYRTKDRPHNIKDEIPKSILQSRFALLTQYVDFSTVKNVLDIGAGNGDFGKLLKKNFDLNIYSIEPDENARRILSDKGYLNFDNKNLKFDLIISTHSLEHFTSIDNFFKIFNNNLSEKTVIFIEVPNNSLGAWFTERPYDSPHCLFFSKKSLEDIFLRRNYKIIFSDYIGDDIGTIFQLMREAKKKFERWQPNRISFVQIIKKIIKKFIPSFILKLRSDIINSSNNSNDKNFKYGNKNSWCLRILVKK